MQSSQTGAPEAGLEQDPQALADRVGAAMLARDAASRMLGMTIDAVWYLLVALVLTGTPWLDRLKERAALIHRITALVLWGFGLSVLFNL